jgi:hypothetical protein
MNLFCSFILLSILIHYGFCQYTHLYEIEQVSVNLPNYIWNTIPGSSVTVDFLGNFLISANLDIAFNQPLPAQRERVELQMLKNGVYLQGCAFEGVSTPIANQIESECSIVTCTDLQPGDIISFSWRTSPAGTVQFARPQLVTFHTIDSCNPDPNNPTTYDISKQQCEGDQLCTLNYKCTCSVTCTIFSEWKLNTVTGLQDFTNAKNICDMCGCYYSLSSLSNCAPSVYCASTNTQHDDGDTYKPPRGG